MKKITFTKKLKVFSIEDIGEAIHHIGEKGYFADSAEEFENTSEIYELEKIEITNQYDERIFICNDGNYKLFAIIEN